jgi:hypothetical protein
MHGVKETVISGARGAATQGHPSEVAEDIYVHEQPIIGRQ